MILRKILSRCVSALTVAAMFASCSSDPGKVINSSISEENGLKISSFDVEASVWGVERSGDGDFELLLVPENSDTVFSFPARLWVDRANVRCNFTIAHPRVIEDGTYNLYLLSGNGDRTGYTLVVRMLSERLSEIISVSKQSRPMSGSGTAQDPYLIAKQTDFLNLIVDLDNEKGVHGKGLHYLQTTDVEVPPQSSMTAGRGYYSTPFAGHYDGGGYKLTGLSYTGAMNSERDKNIGLFSELLPGARVENVCIDGLDINRALWCGAIAGKSSGTVILRNISATGNISDAGDCVGGLVGCVSDTLIVEGYDMNMTLSGDAYVGGVAGRVMAYYTYPYGQQELVSSGYLQVKGMSTKKHHFRITGTEYCGGVAGSIEGHAYVEDISIDHSVQSADQDVTIITATGESYSGGLLGYLKNFYESTLKNVEILAPVWASYHSGGLAGKVILEQPLKIDGCKVSTIISGNNYTGGFFGSCEYNLVFDDEMRTLIFTGNGSKLITDFNAGEVRGKNYTGGICGKFFGAPPAFQTTVTIAMNIKATGDKTGGLFGELYGSGCHLLDLSKIDFSSSTMKISSKGDYVGGVAGIAYYYYLKASNSFTLHNGDKADAYDLEKLTPDFRGSVDGKDYVGGLVGKSKLCWVEGFVMSGSVSGSNYVGGIAGELNTPSSPYTFSKCAMMGQGSVYASGNYAGGIVGSVVADGDGVFEDCINEAPVRGNDYTGGVIGKIQYDVEMNPRWLVNTGAVKGSGSTGGIVGRAEGNHKKLIIENCANYGTVTASSGGGSGVGGIIGCSHSQRIHVVSSANHGLIDCSGSGGAVGGVAGHLGHDPGGATQGENVFMAYCMNSGEVRCSDKNKNVGGILGYQEEGSTNKHDDYCVRDCYNDGHISSDQNDDNGGLVGKVSHYSFVLRCVNYGKVDYGNACIGTRQNSCIYYADYLYYKEGTGKGWSASGSIPESSLSDKSKYHSFDFNNTWQISNGRAELRKCPWQNIRSYPE